MATPLVAGAVALLLQANPTWKPMDVFEALISTSSNKDSPNNSIGWGIISASSALLYSPPSDPRSFFFFSFNFFFFFCLLIMIK